MSDEPEQPLRLRRSSSFPWGSFDSPVFIANPPGDAHRLFVVERPGRVRVIRDGAMLTQPFLDITADVASGGERGLLSIAFPPDYSASGLFYVYYTDVQGDIRIDEFARSAASPDVADPASRRALLEIPHPTFGNHNGGQLQFGPDGLLGQPGGRGEIYAYGLRNPWRFSFDAATGDPALADVGRTRSRR